MAKQKKAQEVSAVRQAKHGWIITLLFTVLSVLWISPIFMAVSYTHLDVYKRQQQAQHSRRYTHGNIYQKSHNEDFFTYTEKQTA